MMNFIKNKFPILINALFPLKFYQSSLKKRKNSNLDYNGLEVPITDRDIDLNDIAYCYFANVLGQLGYKTAIEIGSFDGSRAIALKKNFPSVDVYGADIGAAFQQDIEVAGVKFTLHCNEFFEMGFENTVIFSTGTLSCLRPDELRSFLSLIKKQGYDIAIYEPICCFTNESSLYRSDNSFYHPYHELLSDMGFIWKNSKDSAVKKNYATGFGEYWYTNLAIAK